MEYFSLVVLVHPSLQGPPTKGKTCQTFFGIHEEKKDFGVGSMRGLFYPFLPKRANLTIKPFNREKETLCHTGKEKNCNHHKHKDIFPIEKTPIPCGVVGNTVGFHPATPGSIPGKGDFCFIVCLFHFAKSLANRQTRAVNLAIYFL